MFDPVVLQLNPRQQRLLDERVRLNRLDRVVVEVNKLQTRRKRNWDQLADPVLAGVKCQKVEASLEVVIVSKFFNLVVVDVKPAKIFWNEGIIKPLELV